MENREKKKELVICHDDKKYTERQTVDFYKLRLIEWLRDDDKIVISCTRRNLPIANTVIEEMGHMGFLQGIRYSEKLNKENIEVELIKIPLGLIPACIRLKKEKRAYD